MLLLVSLDLKNNLDAVLFAVGCGGWAGVGAGVRISDGEP